MNVEGRKKIIDAFNMFNNQHQDLHTYLNYRFVVSKIYLYIFSVTRLSSAQCNPPIYSLYTIVVYTKRKRWLKFSQIWGDKFWNIRFKCKVMHTFNRFHVKIKLILNIFFVPSRVTVPKHKIWKKKKSNNISINIWNHKNMNTARYLRN